MVFSKPNIANEVKTGCGNYEYKVKIYNGTDFYEKKFELSYRRKDGESKIFYSTKPGIGLDAACIQNTKNQYLMIFQIFCGGNACKEDMYGVFSPDSQKMIVKPNDWAIGNSNEVKKVLGYTPPFYKEGSKTFFCCNYEQLKK